MTWTKLLSTFDKVEITKSDPIGDLVILAMTVFTKNKKFTMYINEGILEDQEGADFLNEKYGFYFS